MISIPHKNLITNTFPRSLDSCDYRKRVSFFSERDDEFMLARNLPKLLQNDVSDFNRNWNGWKLNSILKDKCQMNASNVCVVWMEGEIATETRSTYRGFESAQSLRTASRETFSCLLSVFFSFSLSERMIQTETKDWLNKEAKSFSCECDVNVSFDGNKKARKCANLHLNRLLCQRPDTWMWRTHGIACARRTSKLLRAISRRKRDGNWIRCGIKSSRLHAEMEIHSRRLRVIIPWHWNPCLPKPLNWRWKERKKHDKIWIYVFCKSLAFCCLSDRGAFPKWYLARKEIELLFFASFHCVYITSDVFTAISALWSLAEILNSNIFEPAFIIKKMFRKWRQSRSHYSFRPQIIWKLTNLVKNTSKQKKKRVQQRKHFK